MRRWAGALALILGLAACSGGDETPSLNLQVIEAGRAVLSNRLNPKPPPPVVTRAVLDTLEGSFMEATVENRDQLAYLFVQARRRDGTPGEIVVWRTEDNITLALRNDVLVGTRGIGNDLLSSDVEIRDGIWGPADGGARRRVIRALDNRSRVISFACELTDLGAATIEIVGRAHATRHLQERCEGGGGTITNEYWVDSRGGLVWQSRQWVSPDVGYLRLRRLTTG